MESQPGRGSDFHFMVPCPAAPADPAHASPLASLPSDLAVLIVDDNETNRLILRDMLVHWGMLPELAVSGKSALELVRARATARRPFDLVLLDARMPEMDGFTVAQLIREDPNLAGPSILMLSSVDLLGGVPGQLDCYLMKPVSRPALRAAMLRAIRTPRSSTLQPARPTPTPSKSDPQRRQLQILVAEDNLVNQKVAQLLLGKKGHHVVIAGDGNQAVQRFSQSHFDLVFMDVQMPQLSGLEATRLIRRHEDPRTRRTPIIALTAHAMASDREECLAAGMDDFLGKPIESQELYAVVTRWTEAAVPEPFGV
jgi:two-component system sensor histidine kinase/response regulator